MPRSMMTVQPCSAISLGPLPQAEAGRALDGPLLPTVRAAERVWEYRRYLKSRRPLRRAADCRYHVL